MFNGCTGIRLSAEQSDSYAAPYRIPTTGTGQTATNAFAGMLTGTGGTFTDDPVIDTTYYKPRLYVEFSSPSPFKLTTYSSAKNWDGQLEYSTNGKPWATWDGRTINASDGILAIRGTGNTVITGRNGMSSKWFLMGSNIRCDGNIETLLDYATVAAGNHPAMADGCY